MSGTWHDKVFFGLHFDIHANKDDVGLGSDLTTEHLVEQFEKIRPDWVQCDCKGHPGYASYPSKVGNAAPGIVKDALRMWRDATKKLGIPLVMHYSGVWDSAAIVAHPEWARIGPPKRETDAAGKVTLVPGKPDVNATCNLSEYTEKLMIPQMIELILDYDVDGFWVDGENWGSYACWCDTCVAEFEKLTGIKEAPINETEPHWNEWLEFQRRNFESHVDRYRAAVKQVRPEVTVCSNWMYTTRQPDDMNVPMDYVSGDFDFIWSTERAMTEARSMDSRNISWDLMDWSFSSTGYPHHWQFKNIEALCSEASVVMSCGGALSFYDTPDRKGHLIGWHMDDLAEVARFCRARQPYCADTRSVRQVAIMNAPSTMYGSSAPLFNNSGSTTIDGTLHAFLDNGHHADILTENDMIRRASEYPLCVVPEQESISGRTVDALLKYAEAGGNLMVSGAELTKMFDKAMGARDTGNYAEWSELQQICIPYGTGTSVLAGRYRLVEAGADAVEIKPLLLTRNRGGSEKFSGSPAASVVRYGKGRIACIYGPAFNSYGMSHFFGIADMVRETVDAMEINGLLRAQMPSGVHMTLRENGDSLFVNFVNLRSASPLNNRSAMVDTIPPAGPIVFETGLEAEPAAVFLAPSAAPLEWKYRDGRLSVTVPQVGIHDILVIRRKSSDE